MCVRLRCDEVDGDTVDGIVGNGLNGVQAEDVKCTAACGQADRMFGRQDVPDTSTLIFTIVSDTTDNALGDKDAENVEEILEDNDLVIFASVTPVEELISPATRLDPPQWATAMRLVSSLFSIPLSSSALMAVPVAEAVPLATVMALA